MKTTPTLVLTFLAALAITASAADLALGIIGLDSSHCTAFTKILNDPTAPNHVAGAKVVAAVKTFSADIESSASRAEQFATELGEKWGVEIVPSIAALLPKVDAVLIASVDGRPHLDQARPVIAAGKPLFIDKPMGGTLRDALEIFRLARAAGVSLFTSSVYRYYPSLVALKQAEIGELRSAISYGPAPLEPHHPDLFWYGIHPTEALYAVLGTGCQSVVRTTSPDTDTVIGEWSGGRTGILHGLRTKVRPHHVTVFGTTGFAEQKKLPHDYAPLVAEIVKFFQTKQPPVAAEETIEMFAFMEAADESKRRGGHPVRLSEVLEQARE